MTEQIGWKGLVERLRAEAPRYAQIFPQLPRLVHQVLEREANGHIAHSHLGNGDMLAMVLIEQRRTNRMLAFLTCLAAGFGVGLVALYLM